MERATVRLMLCETAHECDPRSVRRPGGVLRPGERYVIAKVRLHAPRSVRPVASHQVDPTSTREQDSVAARSKLRAVAESELPSPASVRFDRENPRPARAHPVARNAFVQDP